MNSRKSMLLATANVPPALMLLIIIGLAVLVTIMVTGQMEQEMQAKADSSDGVRSPVIESANTIPQGSTITKLMLSQNRVYEKNIWQDAITTMPAAVGRVAKHTIPAGNQIRETDLN